MPGDPVRHYDVIQPFTTGALDDAELTRPRLRLLSLLITDPQFLNLFSSWVS